MNMSGTDSPRKDVVATGLTVLAAVLVGLLRLVPHPANFTSMGALGIFSGARLRFWNALLLPLAVMIATDCALWGITADPIYSPFDVSRLFVYPAFLLYVLLGKTLADSSSWLWIGGTAVAGSLLFFFVTNFFEWVFQPLRGDIPAEFLYTRDLQGLVNCFVAALPFYQSEAFTLHSFLMVGHPSFMFYGTILGDVFFTVLLFGLYGWLTRDAAASEPALQPVAR
jgi:hypothetical protein